MKRIIVAMLLALVSVKAFPQAMTLDEAIKTTATELGQRINANRIPNASSSNQSIEQTAEEIRRQLTAQTKIAVLNFSSGRRELSTYVIDELNNAIVREGSLTVVNKQQLDLVREELDFQMSGDVDDNSAQSAGKWLGAQSVLSGSFTVISKNTYRFRIRVIAVETGIVQYSNSIDIKNDRVLTALTKNTGTTSGSLFEGYTLYNGLFILGYTYSPDKALGFSFGLYGVYTSLNFAVPDWRDYKKIGDDYSAVDRNYDRYPPDYNSSQILDQRYEIVDWVLGYNVTIVPNILYLSLGVGMESTREFRLQSLLDKDGKSYPTSSQKPEWNPPSQWEKSLLFETGLLFRVKVPYIFGTYRNIGINTHTFSIGAGGSFDFMAKN